MNSLRTHLLLVNAPRYEHEPGRLRIIGAVILMAAFILGGFFGWLMQ